MNNQTHKQIDFGNPIRNLVGNCYCVKKPSNKKILEELLNAMTNFSGSCWNPVSLDGGTDLMLNQCPGACGYVWKLNIKNKNIANWLVNEINTRRQIKRNKK